MSKNNDLNRCIATEDGSFTLLNSALGENYHCREGASREADELYVGSSGFLKAIDETSLVRVLDVGFGLGYNAISTLSHWSKRSSATANLKLTSLEQNIELVEQFASCNAVWQQNWSETHLSIASSLKQAPFGFAANISHHHQESLSCQWDFSIGDASRYANPSAIFDFIWQDPFSPDKNPDMWTTDWFLKLREMSRPHTQLLTYCVSRVAKDALKNAGWQTQVIPTTMKKRSWMIATPLDF